MPETDIYRIIDASLNRSSEGLRTVEDYARFVLNHSELTTRVKELRHHLTETAQLLARNTLLISRDTPNDCGTEIQVPSEMVRAKPLDVASASLSRVQQALRTIEEFGKLLSVEFASRIETIRYQTYTLEKDLVLTSVRHQTIDAARLYVLVDLQGELAEWLERIDQLAAAGADVIQIRDKRADDRVVYERAEAAMKRLRSGTGENPSCRLIINDRADIAAAAGADGVHVGQEELPVQAARRIVGPDKLVGVSTHNLEQVYAAITDGADYIGCGPTFPSDTKTFKEFVGVEFASQATQEIQIPAFAIGGIHQENVRKLIAVGVCRVAVSGAIWGKENEAERCRELAKLLRGEAQST